MTSALEELLTPTLKEPPAASKSDTSEKKKTPSARKTKRQPQSASASAVRQALSVVDPDSEEEVSDGAEQPRTTGARKPRLRSDGITRANGEVYHPRVLSEGLTDIEILRDARAHDLRILLYGFPGCGKTALCEAAFGEALIVVNGHADFEVGDFVGSYIPQPDGTYVWEDGPLTVAMREGRPLLIDDATLIPPGVIARVYPAMDGRRVIYLREHEGEEIKAEEGFFIIAAHNPNAPGAVLSEALASRFALHVHVESDLKMALDLGVNHKAVKVAASLRKARDEGDGYGWAPEMRELLAFKAIESTFGERTAVANLISTAPAEAREEVLTVIRTWHPDADALALKGEAPK